MKNHFIVGLSIAGLLASASIITASASPEFDQFHDKMMACMSSMKDMGLSGKDATARYMSLMTECMSK